MAPAACAGVVAVIVVLFTTVTPDAPANGDEEGPVEELYQLPRRTIVLVRSGDRVERGQPLMEGPLNPAELLLLRLDDPTVTELYIVAEVLRVYESQGVEINDKHIELIVRQMLKKVRVDQKGDTTYLPGQFVDRYDFARENQRIKDDGGETAQFEEIIATCRDLDRQDRADRLVQLTLKKA
jgi:DNA-directed RNA polymerase subunit beta'